jgi:hypothetical protein
MQFSTSPPIHPKFTSSLEEVQVTNLPTRLSFILMDLSAQVGDQIFPNGRCLVLIRSSSSLISIAICGEVFASPSSGQVEWAIQDIIKRGGEG